MFSVVKFILECNFLNKTLSLNFDLESCHHEAVGIEVFMNLEK
jgi:hypothetical protein